MIAQTISSHGNNAIVICNDSTLMVWGANTYYQLGNTTMANSNLPLLLPGLDKIKMVSAGSYHSMALKNDGTVWTWGNNLHGELGNGTNIESHIPAMITSLTNVKKIVATVNAFSLALKNDGTLWAWGNNQYGQLGDGTTTDKFSPIQILNNVIDVAAGYSHVLAIKSDSSVWAWGDNAFGQLGINSTLNSNVPIQIPTLSNIRSVSAGFSYSFAVNNNGSLFSWGGNETGQLGHGDTTTRYTPAQVSSLTDILEIKGGNGHALAIRSDTTVWAWGSKIYGQLGDGSSGASSLCWCEKFPIQITSLTGVNHVEAGTASSFARKNDGSLWAWGINYNGELGDGTYTERRAPVQVNELCNMVSYPEFEEYSDYTIFPNPSEGKYTIDLKRIIKGRIEIISITGEKIMRMEIENTKTEIDLSSIRSGIYFLKIESDKDLYIQKIIKN